MSIMNSIPAEWRSLIKASANVISANPIPITPTIKLPSGNVVPILDISPKQIYQIFLQQKQIASTTKQKLSNKYSNIDIDFLRDDSHNWMQLHIRPKFLSSKKLPDIWTIFFYSC